MLARSDSGGLAVQTWEAWRHLKPARTVVVVPARPRGLYLPELFRHPPEGMEIRRATIPDLPDAIGWALEPPTTVAFTAETWYWAGIRQLAEERGVRLVVQANPELWTRDDVGDVWAPTDWELDRFPPGTPVVPAPVVLPKEWEPRREAKVLFHLAAPAMLDRNGTTDVLAAAELLPRHRFQLHVRGSRRRATAGQGVRVRWLPAVRDYREVIPPDTDVLVLPRRYGGNCLPAQEAAARGIPTLMTDLSPQRGWFADELLVPARVRQRQIPMRGGRFDIYETDPSVLAAALLHLRENPEQVRELSVQARMWATSISWARWEPRYRELLALDT